MPSKTSEAISNSIDRYIDSQSKNKDYISAYTTAPLRRYIMSKLNGDTNIDLGFGTDPATAPSGEAIARKLGVSGDTLFKAGPYNPIPFDVSASDIAGLGIEVAADPLNLIPNKMVGGIAGRIEKIKGTNNILKKYDTLEKVKAIRGTPEYVEYLKALDSEYGNVAKRSKDMGFGDRTWYHGTNVPIEEFKNEALGLSTGAQSAKKGFFFAEDASTASDYADLAREKGVIREGDKVTTKWLSDNVKSGPDHDDVKRAFDNYKYAKSNTPAEFAIAKKKHIENMRNWDKHRKSDPHQWRFSLEREGIKNGDMNAYVDKMQKKAQDRFDSYYANKKPFTKKEIKVAEEKYLKTLEDYIAEDNSRDYVKRHALDGARTKQEQKLVKNAIDRGLDRHLSTGQNVMPVKLKGDKSNIHVKNYKGEGYRDTTYADEMTKAQNDGKTGVLFRNTFDPADPMNRVEQDIAAVFNPNQIRSKFAAFDPRFADSADLLAGASGPGFNPIQIRLQSLKENQEKNKKP